MNPRRSPVSVRLPPHGVYVWETQHDLGFRMDAEAHPFAEIFYVLDGAGVFTVAGQRHECGAGDVVVVPPAAEHVIEDRQSPLTLYGIGVAAELLACDPDALRHIRPGLVPGSRVLAGRVRSGLRRLLFEQTDTQPGGRALTVGLALQLVSAIARASAATTPTRPEGVPGADARRAVERFAAELAHRFYEPVNIDRVAAELGLSRRSFTRLFRGVTGRSYAEHVEQTRIGYACRLLRGAGRGIAPVAFECGYEDLSSFYRAFKRVAGVTPGAWRGAANGRPTA